MLPERLWSTAWNHACNLDNKKSYLRSSKDGVFSLTVDLYLEVVVVDHIPQSRMLVLLADFHSFQSRTLVLLGFHSLLEEARWEHRTCFQISIRMGHPSTSRSTYRSIVIRHLRKNWLLCQWEEEWKGWVSGRRNDADLYWKRKKQCTIPFPAARLDRSKLVR